MKPIDTKAITIQDPYIHKAQENVIHYLLSLDVQKFLFEFYKVAGMKPLTESGYQGWERSDQVNFRGHFFGHFLSALALSYQAEKQPILKKKIHQQIKTAITGLKAVQKNYAKQHPEHAGYISAFKEVALDEVEGKPVDPKEKENVLVPWYNLHKILAGLLEVNISLKEVDSQLSKEALFIASWFGDYIYKRMMNLTDKNQMLTIEYGGMNDALYCLFELTQKKEHAIAATYFDEDNLFNQLANDENVLPGKHANTTIPKLIGALKRYMVFQSEDLSAWLSNEEKEHLMSYFKAAEKFWQIVVDNHTYCTGGNSQSEHFHEPNELFYDSEIRQGDCTCETCNTHNMLKLTRKLYECTKNPKYLDYYETTYINAILASQNSKTGMMMYFQPMGAGYNKVYNRPYDEFWCCSGTGIESFSKLADTYYFKENNRLFVNLYFSNTLKLKENNLKIIQKTDRKNGNVTIDLKTLTDKNIIQPLQLALRLPNWAKQVTIKKGKKLLNYEPHLGFAYLSELVTANDQIILEMEQELQLLDTPDNANYIAFKYGPYILAGELGTDRLEEDNPNGILVRVGTKHPLLADTLTVADDEEWRNNYKSYLKPIERPDKLIAFSIENTNEQLTFSPYYELHDQRYGIYFKLQKQDSKEMQTAIKEKKRIIRENDQLLDELHNFDGNNSEYGKKLAYQRSSTGNFLGRRYRIAQKEGWFSYEFSAKSFGKIYLEITFHSQDVGKECLLILNNNKNERQLLSVEDFAEEGFITKTLLVSEDQIIEGKLNLMIKATMAETPPIFSIRLLKNVTYSENAYLETVKVTNGQLLSFADHQIEIKMTPETVVSFTLPNNGGLVYLNDVLIDEGIPRKIARGDHKLTVFAEDHLHQKDYSLSIIE